KDKKKDKKNKERKHKKDQEEKVVTETEKQSKQPSGLEDRSAEKKKKKKQKKTHSTSEHSKADTSMPTNEEGELPKNLGTSAELDASKEPTNRISGDSKDPNRAKVILNLLLYLFSLSALSSPYLVISSNLEERFTIISHS
ncbi:hypothetical protein A2U01_0047572, partial [Trifolium medium]|nr:hypothetical protein [Trifolium medium]